MQKKILLILLSIIFKSSFVLADEGMWLPLLINKNYKAMQELGIRLTPEQIYSANQSSLKDAVVNFGGFCTGEIISSEGLIMTNHHCAFESIQSHSSVKNDYITDGFWAKDKSQELPNAGLSVTFLIRMEDVTSKVFSQLGPAVSERDPAFQELAEKLQSEAVQGTHYHAELESFFDGNQYFLFVYETFNDVRLVGAPPSAIGKFGGDTDNWMWPRHTGDFSFFRVYAGADGKPAEYSETNVPLKPRHSFPISLKGVKQDDFTMVLGYPGNTDRYLPSRGVQLIYEQKNPERIKIREKRLAIMKEDMDADEDIRIKLSANYYQISNYYKYFIGQNKGIKNLNVIERKRQEEKEFMAWVNADADRKKQYSDIMGNYDKIYNAYQMVSVPYVYLEEAVFGIEILLNAYQMYEVYNLLQQNPDPADLKPVLQGLKDKMTEHFKDYNAPTDRKVMASMLEMYYNNVNKDFHPPVFSRIEKKYKKNFKKYSQEVFDKSFLASQDKFNAFLNKPSAKAMEADPAFALMTDFIQDFRSKIGSLLGTVYSSLEEQDRIYTKAMLEMRKDEVLYPNANFTMRLTYGTVQDYIPRDAVKYHYITTIKGIMEKEDPNDEEFIVPSKLKELYAKGDFAPYCKEGEELPVCFITNNDITGGNSGSPVLNAEGHIIGTAFDGNWEAMSGDIVFEPTLQRCIVTDIRYILFVVDRVAGAGHLIKEMNLVYDDATPQETSGQLDKAENKAVLQE